MRLIVFCAVLDERHSNLGFFHEWIAGLAERFDAVTVIAQKVGWHRLPPNVKVISSRKDGGVSGSRRLAAFFFNCFRRVPRHDAVFVHMMPEYAILAFPFTALFRKPLYLWYAHKAAGWRLKIAAAAATRIFTASKESFRIETSKVMIMGHGINTARFSPVARESQGAVRTFGRISRAKRLEILVEAADWIGKETDLPWTIEIMGEPLDRDGEQYAAELRLKIRNSGLASRVRLLPAAPHGAMPSWYQSTDVFVNLSATGSLDKAVLEAMSAGCSVVTANEAFRKILPIGSFLERGTPENVGRAIARALNEPRPRLDFRSYVEREHNLPKLLDGVTKVIRQDAA